MNILKYIVLTGACIMLQIDASDTMWINIINGTDKKTCEIPNTGTYGDIIKAYHGQTNYASDIGSDLHVSGTLVKSTDEIDQKTVSKVPFIAIKLKRIWKTTPVGSLTLSHPVQIDLKDRENVKAVRKKVKAVVKPLTAEKYFVIDITKDNIALTDTDTMPSYQEPFDANAYGVTIDKLRRIREIPSKTLLGDLQELSKPPLDE